MKDIIKVIWFGTHTMNVYFLPYLWIYSKYFLYFYFFIILSWKLNDDKCLISQLEYKLFGETFMGKKIVSKVKSKIKRDTKKIKKIGSISKKKKTARTLWVRRKKKLN